MRHCHIHGDYDGAFCTECYDRERETADREDEANEYLAFAINNPGNYACPHCKLISLLSNASRCPRCRGAIPESYWESVRLGEAENKKRADEQRRRDQERWSRAAAQQEIDNQRQNLEKQKTFWLKRYFGYRLPLLTILSAMVFHVVRAGNAMSWNGEFVLGIILAFVPIINWLALASAVAFGSFRTLFITCFGFWVAFGIVKYPRKTPTDML